jgi:hypothetical protein
MFLGVCVSIAGGSVAAAPLFLISPTSFDFGAQPLHSPSPQQLVTIKNISGAPIVMNGAGGGAGQFGGSQDCQGLTIPANGSCHMYYQFTPTALGAATGSTGGNWNGQTFSFTFKGTGTPQFRISPTAFDFGDVPVGTTSPQQLVTITNLGTTSVVMTGAGGGAGQFGGSQDCQGLTIAAGNSCHMYYQFHPTSIGTSTGSTGGNWNGQTFSFTFKGNGIAPATGDFVPLSGTRVLDTMHNVGYFGNKPTAGQTVQLFLGGSAIPADAIAADLTVTATQEGGNGALVVWPCGTTRPTTPSISFRTATTIANHVNAKLGTSGAICLRATRATHLFADLDGYYPSTTGFHPTAPSRLLDTSRRIGYTGPKPTAGKVIQVKIPSAAVPSTASAVTLNVTTFQQASAGTITVWPCGTSLPTQTASRFHPNSTITTLAIGKIGSGGKVCIRTSSSTHIAADLVGWYAGATSFTPVKPQRLVDTQKHIGYKGPKPAAGKTVTIKVAGVGAANIPDTARAVVLDLTAVVPAQAGTLKLFPCGSAPPPTAVVSYANNTAITDLAIGGLGTNGAVCVKTSAATHLLVDVVGWYGA